MIPTPRQYKLWARVSGECERAGERDIDLLDEEAALIVAFNDGVPMSEIMEALAAVDARLSEVVNKNWTPAPGTDLR